MTHEPSILDDFTKRRVPLAKTAFMLFCLFVGSLLFLLAISYANHHRLLDGGQMGPDPGTVILVLAAFIFLVGNPVYISVVLHRSQLGLSDFHVVLGVVLYLLLLSFSFLAMQTAFIFQNLLYLDYRLMLTNAAILTALGSPISYIAISRLRRRSLLLPILLCIIIWVLANQFVP